MKSFLSICLLTCTLFTAEASNNHINYNDSSSFDIKKLKQQLEFTYNDITLQTLGLEPYVFTKHISGTGEKFSMAGVYVNLYRNKIKVNVNNISGYMFTSTPWALLSINLSL